MAQQQTGAQPTTGAGPGQAPAPESPATPAAPWRRWLTVPRLVAVCVAVATVAILLRGLLTPAQQSQPTVTAHSTPLPAGPAVGHLAPDISPLDLQGHRVSLDSLRGKVVVLNFWYVACEPCQLEMPALEKAYLADASKGLVVVGLNTSDDAQSITQFANGLGITYPLWRDVGGRGIVAYSVTATPTSYIIDRRGVIRVRYLGPFDSATLNAYLQPLLGES